MRPRSLRTTLTAFNAVMLSVLLAGLGLIYYQTLSRQLGVDATTDLNEVTRALHGYLRFEKGRPVLVYDPADPEEVAFVENATRYYQIYDANAGSLLVQSAGLEPLGLHYTAAEVRAFRESPRIVDMQTDRGRLRFSNSLIANGPGELYLLQVGVPLDVMDSALARMLRLLLISLPAGSLAALVIGRWMAGRALAPLARLAAATRQIDVTDLRTRLPVRGGKDELDEVADAFNGTLARLETTVGEMRQFSAAIAHELRTPLAVIRGETELALMETRSPERYREGLVSQLEELDKLARLIHQLLTLARAEAGEIPLVHERTSLDKLARSVVEQLEAVAQARDLTLRAVVEDGAADIATIGDHGWLQRLLLNLIDNAIKFTPPPGEIVVRVARDGETARIDVDDTGIGVAAEAIPHLFEPFFRADPSRSSSTVGAGLGLALAKWIVDRHRGTILITPRASAGTTVTVRLPLAPD